MTRSFDEIMDTAFKKALERIPIFIKEKKHKKNLKSRRGKVKNG